MAVFLAILLFLTVFAGEVFQSVSSYELKSRIVGGRATTIETFPWQLSVRSKGSHRCGASIISVNRALTAAHCYRPAEDKLEQFTVLAGSTKRLIDVGSVIIGLDKFVQHPNFANGTLVNDIAVLWLQHDLVLGPKIRPVHLPKQDLPLVFGSSGIVTGWGYRRESQPDTVADVLQFTTLTIFTNAKCTSAYKQWFKEGIMFCAGVNGGGKDACQGDSGGPLTTNGVLIGIISWGVRCADADIPGIYTNVAQFRTWIESVII